MKVIHSLALFAFFIFLTACATFQAGTDVSSGRQALFAGNYEAALVHFQAAAQQEPNYVYGTELREGVLSYLGRAQYLTGRLPQARQTLAQALSQHKSDNVARLYLGLTLARQGDQTKALQDIDAGMKGIYDFLNYITETFRFTFGQFWDTGRGIRSAIEKARAVISSGKIDWPQLIADGESIAMRIEREEDQARLLEEQQRQLDQPR